MADPIRSADSDLEAVVVRLARSTLAEALRSAGVLRHSPAFKVPASALGKARERLSDHLGALRALQALRPSLLEEAHLALLRERGAPEEQRGPAGPLLDYLQRTLET